MGIIDNIVENMRELELNEIFKVHLLDRRKSRERSFILRTKFYWDTKDYKVFRSVKQFVIWNNHEFTTQDRDRLNKDVINQLNTTGEAPDLF